MFTVTRVTAPVRTQVQDGLRTMISEGILLPGDRLVERELCEQLGVSRPLVREAMRSLEAEGLLQAGVSGGLFIRTLSLEEAEEIYVARGVLEGGAAMSFVQKGTAEDLAALRSEVVKVEVALQTGDPLGMRRAKNAFYEALIQRCGNGTMAEMLRIIHGRIQLLRSITLAEPDRMPAAVAEIRAIFDAIEAGDAEEARRRSALHIANAAAAMKANWARRSGHEAETDSANQEEVGGK
ncbi:GntR family transcriptional regulator [Martelella endophytica]|uniref:GntR family transcriptional regulator n=1 Tax=Martelella endophytica TaxID=1486262 RepID=UPI000698BB46|nr:GntR family transcriptional regulator [Martelella endophytica]